MNLILIEALLISFLLLAHIFLYRYSAKLKNEKYSEHIKTPHYQLNPLLHGLSNKKMWVRHIGAAVIIPLIYLWLSQLLPFNIRQIYFGIFVTIFAARAVTSIGNILIFSYVKKNPNEISGQVEMSNTLVTRTLLYNQIGLLLPFLLICIFSYSNFVCGVFIGMVLQVMITLFYIRVGKSKNKKVPAPEVKIE